MEKNLSPFLVANQEFHPETHLGSPEKLLIPLQIWLTCLTSGSLP